MTVAIRKEKRIQPPVICPDCGHFTRITYVAAGDTLDACGWHCSGCSGGEQPAWHLTEPTTQWRAA